MNMCNVTSVRKQTSTQFINVYTSTWEIIFQVGADVATMLLLLKLKPLYNQTQCSRVSYIAMDEHFNIDMQVAWRNLQSFDKMPVKLYHFSSMFITKSR